MALDATVGGPNANTYNLLTEFNAYLATRLYNNAKVAAATDPQKETALEMAASLMDLSIVWNGSPASVGQALAFPRIGLTNRNGAEVPYDELPLELKRAHMELAAQLLSGNRTADNDVARLGITDLKVGTIALSFKEDQSSSGMSAVIPDAVLMMLPSTWYVKPVPDGPKIMLETM